MTIFWEATLRGKLRDTNDNIGVTKEYKVRNKTFNKICRENNKKMIPF